MLAREGINQPWILRWQPNGRLRLRLSLDERHNGCQPIHREFDLPKFRANGKELTDQRAMREGIVKTCKQHLAELRTRYPDEDVLAFIGNGNLLANYGFVAWLDGALYHLADEPVFKQPYTSIVNWKDRRTTVEEIWFARENGGVVVLSKLDETIEDITDKIDFATSGQPLVRMGKALSLQHIAEQWYDTRHLVQPLRMVINGTAVFIPNAQLQQGLLRKALCQPVHIRAEAQVDEQTVLPLTASGWLKMARENPTALTNAGEFLRKQGILHEQENINEPNVLLGVAMKMESLLDEALKGAGYRLVDDTRPLREGQIRFINGHLEIFFKKALYPHNMFVRYSNGSCGFVIFPGKSGREGTTLPFSQQFLMEELKVQDAVLLDNGGDVRLWYRGRYLVESSEGREEVRSILALTVRRDENVGSKISVS